MTDRLRGGAPWVRPCGAEDVEEIVRLASLMGRVGPGTEVMDELGTSANLPIICSASPPRAGGSSDMPGRRTMARICAPGRESFVSMISPSSRTIGAGALGEHCSPSFAIGRRSGTQPTFSGNPAKPPSPSTALSGSRPTSCRPHVTRDRMDAPGSAVSNREGIANASLEDVHGYANADFDDRQP